MVTQSLAATARNMDRKMKYRAAYKLLAADNECHTTWPGNAGRFFSRVMVCYPGIVPALSRKFSRPNPPAKSQCGMSRLKVLAKAGAHHLRPLIKYDLVTTIS
uniref:Uncharacterized protein n=2 Tax=Klebsiella pneumoniae TaxID=573 RepID=A0A3G4RJB7_KLEPN|nr:hypothetical protein [Klebsiella pneumoniae]